jgi:competence protein ComEC
MVKIHFLNVGNGDCTIIHFPERVWGSTDKRCSERIMVVDLNHHEAHKEYVDFIEYYKANFKNENGRLKPIFRFICSHPHMDHILGLKKLLDDNDIEVLNFWDLDHQFEPESFEGYENYKQDWDVYQRIRKGEAIQQKIIRTFREDAPRQFWDDEEDRITVLSPSLAMLKKVNGDKEDGSKREPHEIEIDDISYALLIQINNKKVILGGDGKESCWQDIYENCAGIIKDCDILKAAHHGQVGGFHEEAIKLMNPKYIVFSNSIDCDNKDGAEEEYGKVLPNVPIYKTCVAGTIIAECPFQLDKEITFYRV